MSSFCSSLKQYIIKWFALKVRDDLGWWNGCRFLNWKVTHTHSPRCLPHSNSLQSISYLPFHADLMYQSAHTSSSSSSFETQTEAHDTPCSAPCFFTYYILETAPCWHNWTHVVLFNAMAYASGWQTTAPGPNLACCCQFCKYTIIFMDHSHAHLLPARLQCLRATKTELRSWGRDYKVWKT